MDNFEYQLRTLVLYVQDSLNPAAFAMYQPGYITIGYFDNRGQLNVIADTKVQDTIHNTFSKLYEQIQNRIREAEHVEVAVEF